jgi:hypothetical protein
LVVCSQWNPKKVKPDEIPADIASAAINCVVKTAPPNSAASQNNKFPSIRLQYTLSAKPGIIALAWVSRQSRFWLRSLFGMVPASEDWTFYLTVGVAAAMIYHGSSTTDKIYMQVS